MIIDLSKFSDYTIEGIPDYALPYLVNSDSTGLTEEEITTIDEWSDEMRDNGFDPTVLTFVTEDDEHNIITDDEQEASFENFPAFGLPTNCYTCLFVKP